MQQLISVWLNLDIRRRAVLVLSVVAMLVTLIGLSRLATAPTMSLLYSNLDATSAGEIVGNLEQRGVNFEIRGSSIYVDSVQRDRLRMTLASEGLPANDGQGYELLDSLSGFGTTAQMFDAAYWRAKEGELARTIVASPQFRSARVHISNNPSQPFRKAVKPTASVTVSSTGGTISGANAQALRYLVSSAVAGMTPGEVSIIDGRSGTMVQDDTVAGGGSGGVDRAEELKQNVERLLRARVGAGNAIVEVYVETVTQSESIIERTFDPDSRVAISTQKEERSSNSNDTQAGSVTVASNLPAGDGAAGDNNSSAQNTESREQTNYEVSETTREIVKLPGSIQRISTAVLVDGLIVTDPNTSIQTWSARSAEELAALRELISSAVGFDADRGDILTLKSMQFQTLETTGAGAQSSFLPALNFDMMRVLQLLVLTTVTLVLGLFVLRPILLKAPVPALQVSGGQPGLLEVQGNQQTQPQALIGEIDERVNLSAELPIVQANALEYLHSDQGVQGQPDPVELLRSMISDRQGETVEILRNWVDGSEERV